MNQYYYLRIVCIWLHDSRWPGIVSDFHNTQMILKYAIDIKNNGNLKSKERKQYI